MVSDYSYSKSMTARQNSNDIDLERKGFLSKRERQWLLDELVVIENGEAAGENEITKNYHHKIKSTIKSKTRDSIKDFDLVFENLPDEVIQEVLIESDGTYVPDSPDEQTLWSTLGSAEMHLDAVSGATESDVSKKETVGIVMKLVRRVLTADDKIRGAFDVMTDVFADYRSKEEIIQYIEETWPESDE